MVRVLMLALLLLQSCATPVSSFLDAGGMVLVMLHADDTPEEQNDYLTRRITRAERWCREGEEIHCEKARVMKKEREEVQKQLLVKE